MSNLNYSFEQWCIDHERQDLLDRWDYELNNQSPNQISFKSNNKYWFKCPQHIHESELHDIQYVTSGKCQNIHCKKCDSFAQFIINKFDEQYLNDIWNDDNLFNPWEYSTNSKKKGLFNCLNNGDHIFSTTLSHYTQGSRCPYCSGLLCDIKKSAGVLNPNIFNIWSDKNDTSPYDYTLHSGKQVWWRCENNIHEDYQRSLASSYDREYKCPKCSIINQHLSCRIDLTGERFGELVVRCVDTERTKQSNRVYWVCDCSCGAVISTSTSNLTSGNSTTCGNRTIHYSKENNGNWQGGKTPDLLCERTSLRYNKWRDEVYKKDWYTCQCCGRSHNIIKNAHHLINFSDNEDMRYDINNGITLCGDCHYSTIKGSFHNIYGTQNNTEQQLEEYINNKRKELDINIPFSINSYKKGEILKPRNILKEEA